MHEGSGRAAGAEEVDDQIEGLRVEDGRGLKIFSGGGGSGEDEDAGADNGSDA